MLQTLIYKTRVMCNDILFPSSHDSDQRQNTTMNSSLQSFKIKIDPR